MISDELSLAFPNQLLHILSMQIGKKNNKRKSSATRATPDIAPIDHVVISLDDLKLARTRFEALGFNVNDVATHSFGTQNTIIPLSNGTFIEPLAVGDVKLVAEHITKAVPFVVRHDAFRFRHTKYGGPGGNSRKSGVFAGGFSMLAFCGKNAKRERKKFRKAGIRTGKLTVVKRPGLKLRASFALDEHSPDCTLFSCERPEGAPKFDETLTNHANGASAIARITMVEQNPSDFSNYLETVTGQHKPVNTRRGLDFNLPNGTLSVMTPAGLKTSYGIELPPTDIRRGLQLITFDIAVRSLDKLAMLLAERGIEARQVGKRIVVANAPGQGTILAFVEEKR